MKMKNYINPLIILSVILLVVSCSDDFLERPPESEIIPEEYLYEESQFIYS